jgi:hypothetical protein
MCFAMLALVGSLGAAAAGTVSAAGSVRSHWKIEPTPSPSEATDVELSGVSCPSPRACVAVGSYQNSSGVQVTLAEGWNGASWRIEATQNPSGSSASSLVAVSCRSTTECVAVGSGSNGALAEGWNGKSWSIQTAANPVDGGASLAGISCFADNACIAVGSSNDGILAEALHGTKWTIQPTPFKAGESPRPQYFYGVSCVSAAACVAVGVGSSGPNPLLMAEGWNGTKWSQQNTPAYDGNLLGVSCFSSDSCGAVGWSGYPFPTKQTTNTEADEWNGSSWSTPATPEPKGSTSDELEGVSCSAADACTAVGGYTDGAGHAVTLAEVWNGTTWRIQATPHPAGSTGSLTDVWCTAATACMAVGNSDGGPLAERYAAA